MPDISPPNNTEPRGPTHLNMIEMAAPSNDIFSIRNEIVLKPFFRSHVNIILIIIFTHHNIQPTKEIRTEIIIL